MDPFPLYLAKQLHGAIQVWCSVEWCGVVWCGVCYVITVTTTTSRCLTHNNSTKKPQSFNHIIISSPHDIPPPHTTTNHNPPPPHTTTNHNPPPPHTTTNHNPPPPHTTTNHNPPPPHTTNNHNPPPPHTTNHYNPPPTTPQGAGTDEKVLIEIICPRPNHEIKAIKSHYENGASSSPFL